MADTRGIIIVKRFLKIAKKYLEFKQHSFPPTSVCKSPTINIEIYTRPTRIHNFLAFQINYIFKTYTKSTPE
jgi:hypothetical protein